jgi:hypothetical protein
MCYNLVAINQFKVPLTKDKELGEALIIKRRRSDVEFASVKDKRGKHLYCLDRKGLIRSHISAKEALIYSQTQPSNKYLHKISTTRIHRKSPSSDNP